MPTLWQVMLTGDFNCDDGYEQSKPVLYLKGELDNSPITFDDTFRSYNGDGADGTTFPGKPGDILLSRLELETNVIRRFAKISQSQKRLLLLGPSPG